MRALKNDGADEVMVEGRFGWRFGIPLSVVEDSGLAAKGFGVLDEISEVLLFFVAVQQKLSIFCNKGKFS